MFYYSFSIDSRDKVFTISYVQMYDLTFKELIWDLQHMATISALVEVQLTCHNSVWPLLSILTKYTSKGYLGLPFKIWIIWHTHSWCRMKGLPLLASGWSVKVENPLNIMQFHHCERKGKKRKVSLKDMFKISVTSITFYQCEWHPGLCNWRLFGGYEWLCLEWELQTELMQVLPL